MSEDEMKAWIDSASYDELLRKWRFSPAGDPFFCGEVGSYYRQRMAEKREQVGHDGHVAASKAAGWDR